MSERCNNSTESITTDHNHHEPRGVQAKHSENKVDDVDNDDDDDEDDDDHDDHDEQPDADHDTTHQVSWSPGHSPLPSNLQW